MKFTVVTPERTVLEADVDAVYAKSVGGEIGILHKHVPLITPLEISILTYHQGNQKIPMAVMGGMLRTDGETVTVLSDAAELNSEVDAVRAQHAKERAEARLRERHENVDTARAEQSLARALARLKLGQ